MANKVSLDVQLRDIQGKKVKQLRQQGLLPATVYGKGFGPLSVQVDERAFSLTYRQAGRTALIDLNIPGQKNQAAFIHAIQRHPVSRRIIHADFRVVDLQRYINIEVPVMLVGESPVVKRNDGILIHGLTTVQVHALPADLPQHIEVDVSVLDSFEKSLYVRDLPTSDNYSFVTSGDELIAALSPLRAAEEAPVEGGPTEPELIRRERAPAEE